MHLNSCITCNCVIRNIKESKSCASCKKLIHINCDTSVDSNAIYTCINCQEKTLIDDEKSDAILSCVTTDNPQSKFFSGGTGGLESDDDDELELDHTSVELKRHSTRSNTRRVLSPSGSNFYINNVETSNFGNSHTLTKDIDNETLFNNKNSLHNQNLINIDILSKFSSPTLTTKSTEENFIDDSTLIANSECQISDNDEYKPPTSKQMSRNNNRVTQNKKKLNFSRQATSMRTRSGGKPPTTSYANIGYEEKDEKNERSKRSGGRSSVNKGKGNRGGRRRNLKFNYLYTSSSAASSYTKNEDYNFNEYLQQPYEKTKNVKHILKNSSSIPTVVDENDYIRTAIVTNAADKFMNSISLCLICGSVGKDLEGSMLTCASCAQSYHTFCVGMHDKLNSTVLKRGWRCLDCTVCEGCGDGKDESNLLLCDECDVSFHIYCLNPPLERIPQGSWRCEWCAMCCRCNKKVQSSLDLQRLEGLCETCYSLRKCLKCNKLYEVGELLIKCQRCIRWFHAKCEELVTEEQVENAAENAFRCSFCRPQLSSYNDIINMFVIVDNVMIDKSAADYIQSYRRISNPVNTGIFPDYVTQKNSYENEDYEGDDLENSGNYGTHIIAGRGGNRGVSLSGGRGGGPGRRMVKIGVGGFNVKIPRHRLLANNAEDSDSLSGFNGPSVNNDELDVSIALNGKPKIRRPRRPRRPQLEDAYPAPIQEFFFGCAAVDSRTLAEQVVDEPVLGEYKRTSLDFLSNKTGCELSEHSSELLRQEQEQDMLGDIFGGGIDLDFDLDLNDIMDGAADDDDGNDENSLIEKSLTDGFSATESTGLITGGMCSPSTSGIGFGEFNFGLYNCQSSPHPSNVYKADSASMQHHLQMQQDDQRKRQQQLQSRLNMGNTSTISGSNSTNTLIQRCNFNKDYNEMSTAEQRATVSSQATERWEEDEPLGDKATKAAVLYANLCHPQLKIKYPQWSERVKQINKEWRTLDAEKRQFYVDMARKNRANSGVPRRRTRRLNILSSSVTTSLSNSISNNDSINTQSSADLISAHVTAIKQAQTQSRVSTDQQKSIGNGNVTKKLKTPNLSQENESSNLIQENGNSTQLSDVFLKKNFENGNPDNIAKEIDDTETVQSVVRSMIKQQQQIQQRQVLLDAENQVFLKRRIAELELEQEEHDNELIKFKKIKKNLTAKYRQLLKCQVRISENDNSTDINSNNSIQTQKMFEQEQTRQQKALIVSEEASEINCSLEETKRAIQSRTKQLDCCRQEIKEKSILIQQIEKRQNQTANASQESKTELNVSTNEQVFLSQPCNSSNFNATNYVSHPSNAFNVTSTNSFVVRQFPSVNSNVGEKPQNQQQLCVPQQTSSQYILNAVSKNTSSLVSTQAKNYQPLNNFASLNSQSITANQLLTEKSHSKKQLEKKLSNSSLKFSTTNNNLSEINNKLELNSLSMIPKSGRGRKRKKVFIDEQKPVMLGNISYSSLETQFEKDIYDCVSSLINQVVSNINKSTGDSIRRIINSQMLLQSKDSISLTNIGYTQKSDSGEPLKIKKKRQQFKKQIVNDSNEIEQAIERTQNALDLLRFPKRSLKQFYELDKNVLIYPLITGFPDRPGKTFIKGNQLGDLLLLFMPDYYTTIETGKIFEEESLYPKSMVEICAGVNLNALVSFNDDEVDIFTKETVENVKDDSNQSFLYQEPEVYYLSTRCLNDKSRIKSSCLLLGPCNPERQLPLEPHRFIFNKEICNLKEKKFKISMTVDMETIANATELIERLEQILDAKQVIDFQIETPPQSPTPNNNLLYQKDIKLELDEPIESISKNNSSSNLQLLKAECKNENAKKCRNCERKISYLQTVPIEENMSSLGLTPPDDKDMKVLFCSMKCYYKYMVIVKLPLSVELLDKAEKYVDAETIEKLRQISADSFAKKIQQTSTDQRVDINLQPSALLSPVEYQNDQLNYVNKSLENLLDLMRQPREHVIKASELQTIAANKETQNNLTILKSEYKWKGHSWMVCNVALLHSFQRLHDEVKKRCVSIQLNQHEKYSINRLEDTRICILCGEQGDGDLELTGRLLNVDANEWIHVNCALWSTEVHETEIGALLNVDAAICRAKTVSCCICKKKGASLMCYKLDCKNHSSGFHLTCAKQNDGKFIRDKTFYCPEHEVRQEMRVYRFDALRRIYIQRDENQLLAKIFNHSYSTEMMMRVGSLIFQKIGQLLPEQLKSFHNENHIFPIGYRVKRIFWSPTNSNDRVQYECFIDDRNNSPEFCVLYEGREFRDSTPSGAWNRILTSVLQAREKAGNSLKFFINQTKGETLFGFTESAITKMTESLPGVDQLYTYTFKHGGSPLMDLPLAVNPSGCARCEPCFRTLIKHRYRPLISISPKKKDCFSQSNSFNAEVIPREARSTRSSLSRFHSVSSKIDEETLKAYKASGISEEMLSAPYFRLDLSFGNYQIHSHYRTMQKEWHNNVYLARSKIQGLGLYAKRDINMHAMIIEYKGEVIRSEVGEMREKKYMSQNRGVYMFRIDDEWLIDATLAGGLARYINHSCDPNCSTKILQYNDDKKIIIIANRPIKAGEELTYDYQFELEDTTDKLPCLCGAPNCNKWMN